MATEPEDKTRAYLAYTRRTGWVVVEWKPVTPEDPNSRCLWYLRGASYRDVRPSTILAWADLPPPPPEAG